MILLNGILNILKPPGMTSQNVVSYVKRICGEKKAGHTGTLDPGAAGVLPVCLGNSTRISEYLLNDKKSYRAEMELGFMSDTLDKYGKVLKLDSPHLTDDSIHEAFESFKGSILQLPPMYSAVKKGGVRLYELARQGITVEREYRKSIIYDIRIIHINGNSILFDVTCSKGTYIRTLCSDIGNHLGTDAIMTFLLRTCTGPFNIEDSITLDELKNHAKNHTLDSVVYPTYFGLSGMSSVTVDDDTYRKVKNGVGFPIQSVLKYCKYNKDDLLLIFSSSSEFIAIGSKDKNGYVKIDKVFS